MCRCERGGRDDTRGAGRTESATAALSNVHKCFLPATNSNGARLLRNTIIMRVWAIMRVKWLKQAEALLHCVRLFACKYSQVWLIECSLIKSIQKAIKTFFMRNHDTNYTLFHRKYDYCVNNYPPKWNFCSKSLLTENALTGLFRWTSVRSRTCERTEIPRVDHRSASFCSEGRNHAPKLLHIGYIIFRQIKQRLVALIVDNNWFFSTFISG